MKISKTKLEEIIKEELASLEETLYDDRYDDVERMRPRRYRSEEELEAIRRDMKQREKDDEHRAGLDRRKDAGLDEAGPPEKKHDHQAGLKVVSRDGKKKGWKTSGTWKSGKIKVKWKGEKGIHQIERPDYTRKNWK